MKNFPNCRVPRLRGRIGRCYELAYLGAERANEWVIVHGEVSGPPGIGRIGHAWLELDGEVFETTRDELHDALQYCGRYSATVLAKYTYKEAALMVVKEGHYGPWHGDRVTK